MVELFLRLRAFLKRGQAGDAAKPCTAGPHLNPNAYDNRTLSLRLGATVSDQIDFGLIGHYIQSTLYSTSDDFLGPESMLSRNGNNEFFTRGFAHMTLLDGRFDQTLGLAFTGYDRIYSDPNIFPLIPNLYQGQRVKVDYQGNFRLVEGEILTFGAEREEDYLGNSNPLTASIGDTAGFAQLQSSIGGRLFNAASIRYDANDQFGNALTYRIAPAFLIPETGTTLKGRIGTGFKAPTLDEFYDNYPAYGFFAPWDRFSVRADYTYTIAKDEITQLDLLRRPRDKFSLSATLQASPALLLSATFVYTGPWLDTSHSGTATNLIAPGYTLLNLAANYDLGERISAFGRINNALNVHYQNPLGFEQPGLGVYGGIKAAFGPEGFL